MVLTSGSGNPAAGDWGRIEFDPGSSGTVTHAEISYAGGSHQVLGWSHATYSTGILIWAAAPTISNSTVDHSAGNGIEAVSTAGYEDPGADPTLAGDTLSDNASWAVLYDYWPNQLTGASGPQVSALSASANGYNLFGVTGGNAQASGEWHDPGMPIRTQPGVGRVITIPVGITWTIDAGTTIQFTDPDPYWSGAHQTIYVQGALDVSGTAASHVVLTSGYATPAAGDWGRIEFDPGSSGTISYAHLSYAGGPHQVLGWSHATYSTGILALNEGLSGAGSGTANPTVIGTVFDHSAGNDVEAAYGALPVLNTNSFLAAPAGF